MQLSFEKKEAIFDLYESEGLIKYGISNGRINYKYNDRVIIRELNPKTGNGYICGKFLEENEYNIDSRGWVNIKLFSVEQIKDLIEDSMISFLVYL